MGMQLVETIEVGSGGAASLEFTSIPDTGTDLVVKFSGRYSNLSSAQIQINLNGDTTTSNYTYQLLRGSSSTASAINSSNTTYGATMNEQSDTASCFSNVELYFPNYNSSLVKTWLMTGVRSQNSSSQTIHNVAYKWNNSNAITSIKLASSSGDLAQYSIASLYMITE